MKLQETLEHLNFSRLEAQIYMALIGSEPMSAYQLAKKIAIARPSIYNALEHMLDKGMVELVPDQTALYAAQEPEAFGADAGGNDSKPFSRQATAERI